LNNSIIIFIFVTKKSTVKLIQEFRFNMRCKIIDNRKEGQQRIVSKYLYIPKRIGNERRWLERVSIKQTLYRMFDVTCGACWWEWRDTEWVENVV